MAGLELLSYKQLEFHELNNQSEIAIKHARNVLTEIIRRNPGIHFVSYFAYDMRIDSDDELVALNLTNLSSDKVTRKVLQKISDNIRSDNPYLHWA